MHQALRNTSWYTKKNLRSQLQDLKAYPNDKEIGEKLFQGHLLVL